MRKDFNESSLKDAFRGMKEGEIVHVPTGAKVTKQQMLDAVSQARVIYVSERHDNCAAHDAQLDVVRDLCEKHPGKIAVGMEMFRKSAQTELDLLGTGGLTLDAFNKLFDEQWSAGWRASYQPLLDYIHAENIPVVGLRPRKETEDLVRAGRTGADVPELDMNDPHHRARHLPFFSEMGVPPEAAEAKYRIMVLWDEAMAEAVADFLSDPANADRKMVVIAGSGHIHFGFGIPDRVERRVPHDRSIVALMTEYDVDDGSGLPPGEYAWRVPYILSDERPAAPPKRPPSPGTGK